MKKILGITTVSILALCAGTSSASAEVFMHQTVDKKLTLTYADSWRRIHNQEAGDVLTVRAPGKYEFAECKVNISDDGRFKIYPAHYNDEIQRLHISENYWADYLSRYNDVVVHQGTDNNGLGRGFASMVSASYETAKGAKMKKRAIGFASYYQNNIYTVECSAEESVYHKWHNAFLSLIKSVDFNSKTNFAITGYYRNFLGDKTLKVRGPDIFDDTYR